MLHKTGNDVYKKVKFGLQSRSNEIRTVIRGSTRTIPDKKPAKLAKY